MTCVAVGATNSLFNHVESSRPSPPPGPIRRRAPESRAATALYRALGVARFFDDVLVLASRSLPKAHTEALTPWDLARLQPYSPEFLAGFRAEGYTVSIEEGMATARAHMDQMIERDVRFDIGGDRQEIDRIETRLSDVTFKHVLLPVWLAAYRFRGRSYRFVVNGQTGKVSGERPYSPVKIAAAAILALILAGGAIYVAERNGWLNDAASGWSVQFGN